MENLQEIREEYKKGIKTSNVAKLLGETTQTIRNYCRLFLDDNHKPGQHRYFSQDDINKLLLAKKMYKEWGYDPEQIKEILKTNIYEKIDIEVLGHMISNQLEKSLLDKINSITKENLKSVVKEIIETSNKNTEKVNKNVKESCSNTVKTLLQEHEKNRVYYDNCLEKYYESQKDFFKQGLVKKHNFIYNIFHKKSK